MESKIHSVEHSYFEFRRIVSGLIARYPFMSISNAGKSVAGRDIPILTIGSGNDYTLFVSGDNPNCRITPLILLSFAEELCHKILSGKEMCGINIRKAMFGRGIIILPLLNPDGFEIIQRGDLGCGYLAGKLSKLCGGDYKKWRSNLRGVEIVRNFSYGYDARRQEEKENRIFGPKAEGFSGYRPESEPETVALTELCRSKNIRQMINLSAYGQTVSYSGVSTVPPRSVKMAEVMAAVSSFTVTPPIAKNIFELNDWFTYEFQRPGLGVRIGAASVPPVSELNYWYARVRELLTISCLF